MRRRGSPTFMFGTRAFGNRGGYRPYGYRPYGRPYGYGRGGGGSCLRDACLIESGCCLAESLGDSCLLGIVLMGQALAGLVVPGRPKSSNDEGRPVAAIRVYQQRVSPRRRACCRFTPTCSEYAAQALIAHGNARGGWLALRRLVRCRPYGRRGADPVPAR